MVYVDKDLEAVNQSHNLLSNEKAAHVTIVEGDLREPDSVLDHPDTQRLLDFNEPVGLVIIAVWPFVSDDENPYELMARYRDRLAPGSCVAMSQNSIGEVPDEVKEMCTGVNNSYDETADPVTSRSREQVTAFFDGLTIVDPGVVRSGLAPRRHGRHQRSNTALPLGCRRPQTRFRRSGGE